MDVKMSGAVTIQSAWRCYYTQLVFSCDLMDIILVQSLVRQRAANNELQRRREAAVMLQCMARNWIAVRKMFSLLDERDEFNRTVAAASIIQ
eukprot:4181322-Ditylum_brightwellii.AAC.1